jgi:hypothetical protein
MNDHPEYKDLAAPIPICPTCRSNVTRYVGQPRPPDGTIHVVCICHTCHDVWDQ